MRTKTLLIMGVMAICCPAFSQASLQNGPELDNDRNSKMNRMLGGDENSFYCYRVRSKGKGTSFIVEKYDKKTLQPLFSKEINLDEEKKTRIEDVEYSNGNVFVFRRQYDKKTDQMTLFYQTVSSAGVVSEDLKEVVSVTADHFEFVNFDIFPNPSKTRFVIKASHKPNKTSGYQTDFILMDAVAQKKLWTKTIDEKLFSNTEGKVIAIPPSGFLGMGKMIEVQDIGFIGLSLDDNDNIYYAYSSFKNAPTESELNYSLILGILNAGDVTPVNINLPFEDEFFVRDVEFHKTNTNQIVIGGFMKSMLERKGRDYYQVGIFSFSVDLSSKNVAAKSVKIFDDKLLYDLESTVKRAGNFKYKLDYIFPIDDAIYFVGEQYKETMIVQTNYNNGVGTMGAATPFRAGYTTSRDVDYEYEYMDVLVAKLNASGEFEWVKNLPLRQIVKLNNYTHVFKQYIAFATKDNIYILNDDHPKNIERYMKADFEPRDLKNVSGIHGSNFVCNQLNLKTLEIKREVLMKNEDYCFAPIQERDRNFMPPSDCEIFVPSSPGEIIIYTEDRGRDRFAKITFK